METPICVTSTLTNGGVTGAVTKPLINTTSDGTQVGFGIAEARPHFIHVLLPVFCRDPFMFIIISMFFSAISFFVWVQNGAMAAQVSVAWVKSTPSTPVPSLRLLPPAHRRPANIKSRSGSGSAPWDTTEISWGPKEVIMWARMLPGHWTRENMDNS